MAVTVHPDQIDDEGGRHTAEGWEFTRGYTVEGLTSVGARACVDAVNAAGIPRIGMFHPVVPTCTVREQIPDPQGGGIVKVRVVYRGSTTADDPADQTIEVGTSLQSVQTNKDLEGNYIFVEYDGPESKPETKKQIGTLTVLRPRSTIRVRRTESASPGAKSREYVGKVNAANQFALALNDAAARVWLCTSIVGLSGDGGETYQVSYDFEYAAETFDQEIIWIHPETGRAPDGLADDPETYPDAHKTVQVYVEANFNQLRLT